MAWTAPRTWVTGELVTASIMNTHVRDNLLDLDQRTLLDDGGYSSVSEARIFIGSSTPGSPNNGDIWLDTSG